MGLSMPAHILQSDHKEVGVEWAKTEMPQFTSLSNRKNGEFLYLGGDSAVLPKSSVSCPGPCKPLRGLSSFLYHKLTGIHFTDSSCLPPPSQRVVNSRQLGDTPLTVMNGLLPPVPFHVYTVKGVERVWVHRKGWEGQAGGWMGHLQAQKTQPKL